MEFFSTLFLLGAFNGLLLAYILLVNSSKKLSNNRFLGVLLIIISGYIFKQFLINQFSIKVFPHFIGSFVPLMFLIGPLFYFYIKYEVQKNVTWTKMNYIHAIPSILSLLILLPFYLKPGNEKYLIYFNGHHYFPFKGVFYWCFGLLMVMYSLKSLKLTKSNTKEEDGRSNRFLNNSKMTRHFTWLLSTISLCYLIALTLLSFTTYHHTKIFNSIILAFSFLIHFVGFWSIKESKIIKPTAISSNKTILNDTKIKDIKKVLLCF